MSQLSLLVLAPLLTFATAGIQRLHLDQAPPLPPSPPEPLLVFPHLVELSFSDSVDQLLTFEFLQKVDLPQLRSFGIYRWCDSSSAPWLSSWNAALGDLAPQLDTLSFLPLDLSDLEDHDLSWSKFTRLRKLSLPDHATTAHLQILKAIPAKLESFRIVCLHEDEMEEGQGWEAIMEQVLQEWPRCMERLSYLELPEPADDRLARLCSAKGVEDVGVSPSGSCWHEWEQSVFWWWALELLRVPCARR